MVLVQTDPHFSGQVEDLEEEKMLSIFNEKIVITAGIFCATMVFGMMPIQVPIAFFT